LDASVPIAGFLPPQSQQIKEEIQQTNYFAELLDKADGVLTGNWPDVTVRFWRFGKGEPQSIPNIRNFYVQRYLALEKRDPRFDFSEQETHIDTAVKSNVPTKNSRDELKIIVTDLFQDENDIDNLVVELMSLYLNQPEKAISVLGIRNYFFGKIYDLPGNLPEGAADSLPFYILICGKLPDVQHATDLLRERLRTDTALNRTLSIIYSSHPIAESTQPLALDNSANDVSYTVYTNLVAGAAEQKIPQVEISKGKDVELRLKDFPGGEVSKVANPAFKLKSPPKATAQRWDQRQNKYVQDESFQSAFEVDAARKLIAVHSAQLEKKSMYLVTVDLEAAPGDMSDVNTWALEMEDFPHVLSQQKFDEAKDGRHPGKTPNLKHFLKTMTDKVFQTPVPLARYYLYVKII
jgi:hypothetical protein